MGNSLNPVILIPARLASTRLPNKPLAEIAGEAMILHVWRRAMEAALGPVVVAAAEEAICEVIDAAGGTAVLTRADHPSGSDRIFEALQSIDRHAAHDVVINLQGDLPTLDPQALRSVVLPLTEPTVDIATLAALIREPRERLDPNVVKVAADLANGKATARAHYFSRSPVPWTGEGDDQPLYHHIGIYAYRRAALERFISLPPSGLEKRERLEQLRAIEAGMRIDVALVDTVPLGVDTPADLARARQTIAAKKG